MNSITICGRLGQDPELQYTPSGVAACSISVAEDKKKGGEEYVVWYNCTAYREMAEKIQQFFTKGKPIFITGTVREVRAYKKKNGEPGASLDVQIESFQFVPFGGKPQERKPGEPEEPTPPAGVDEVPDITDPFADQ